MQDKEESTYIKKEEAKDEINKVNKRYHQSSFSREKERGETDKVWCRQMNYAGKTPNLVVCKNVQKKQIPSEFS